MGCERKSSTGTTLAGERPTSAKLLGYIRDKFQQIWEKILIREESGFGPTYPQ
jgi:hypothetical protein